MPSKRVANIEAATRGKVKALNELDHPASCKGKANGYMIIPLECFISTLMRIFTSMRLGTAVLVGFCLWCWSWLPALGHVPVREQRSSRTTIGIEGNRPESSSPSYFTRNLIIRTKIYSVRVAYPEFIGLGPASSIINQQIKKHIHKEVHDAQERLSLDELVPSAPKGYLRGKYEVCLLTPKIVSVRFSFSGYSPGAAHPYDWTTAFNYRVRPPRAFTTQDLFVAGIDPILVLSVLSQRELTLAPEQFVFDWVEEASGPKKENFRSLTFDKHDLCITFDEYQVNAYAAGPYSINIPYGMIKDLMPHNSPLWNVAQSDSKVYDDFLLLSSDNWRRRLAGLAIGRYSKILVSDPGNAQAYYKRGKWYQELQRPDAAKKDFAQALYHGYNGTDRSELEALVGPPDAH